jgi:hypothetical protein
VVWKRLLCLPRTEEAVGRYIDKNRGRHPAESVESLQAHLGFTLPVSAHLRTVADHLTTPLSPPIRLIRTLNFPRKSEHPQVLKLQKEKASTTTPNEVNGILLFRPQADLGTHSRVADAGNRTLDSRDLKNFKERRYLTGQPHWSCEC